MNYQGKPGKCITTVEELKELADNRKPVAVMMVGMPGTRVIHSPLIIHVSSAIAYLNRPASCILRDLQYGNLYEYIKPQPKPRGGTIKRYRRKTGKREGIRRTLSTMIESKSDHESCGLMEILYGLDPVLAESVAKDVEKWLPDMDKVRVKLIEMEQEEK